MEGQETHITDDVRNTNDRSLTIRINIVHWSAYHLVSTLRSEAFLEASYESSLPTLRQGTVECVR